MTVLLAGVIALVAAVPAAAAPPWSAPAVIPGTDAPPRVEANELDQSVLVPRITSGKLGAGPQLVQWRGGGGRPSAGGAGTARRR